MEEGGERLTTGGELSLWGATCPGCPDAPLASACPPLSALTLEGEGDTAGKMWLFFTTFWFVLSYDIIFRSEDKILRRTTS